MDEEVLEEQDFAIEAKAGAASVVDVGSGLAADDWSEIDDKGVRCWCFCLYSLLCSSGGCGQWARS